MTRSCRSTTRATRSRPRPRRPGGPIKIKSFPELVDNSTSEGRSMAAPSALGAPLDARRSGPPTALVVEARQTWRRGLVSLLETHGWNVLEADSDKSATLALIDRQIDCVLFGTNLGEHPVDEYLRGASVIRKAQPQPYGMLVVVDAESTKSSEKYLESGADDVVGRRLGVAILRRMRLVTRLLRAERERDLLRAKLEADGSAAPSDPAPADPA